VDYPDWSVCLLHGDRLFWVAVSLGRMIVTIDSVFLTDTTLSSLRPRNDQSAYGSPMMQLNHQTDCRTSTIIVASGRMDGVLDRLHALVVFPTDVTTTVHHLQLLISERPTECVLVNVFVQR